VVDAPTLLALKLLLVPALLAVISMAGRRWGPGVAGWLAGFPSLTGPILFFLAIERGAEFTTQAAILSLSSVFAAIAFGVTYARACRRFGVLGSLACAYAAWTLAALLLSVLPLTVGAALLLAFAALFIAQRAYPRAQGPWRSRPLPASELLARMGAGAAMVLGVTAAAEALGSVWTGLFGAFPVMSTVLAAFSHRANGQAYVVSMLRAMIGGFYAYIAYCLAVAALLEPFGILVTFCVAVAAAVTVQGAAKAIMMRMERR
jgi:uncharacterized membrane protein (GlpM family)